MDLLTIDGVNFNVQSATLRRGFEVREGGNSGVSRSGRMRRDLLGTYCNYTLVIDASGVEKTAYDQLYELLSSPVESHIITAPYGQGSITFEAYVTSGEDSLQLLEDDGSLLWGDLNITFQAIEPQRGPADG